MRLSPLVAASLLMAAPALAQPASKTPTKTPATPAATPGPAAPAAPAAPKAAPAAPKAAPAAKVKPAAGATDADYDREMAALFTSGGLTADQAAQRTRTVSPDVKRKIAEAAEAAARTRGANVAWVPIVRGTARYTRLSELDPATIDVAGMSFPFPSPPLNNYSLVGELNVPISEYLLRVPQLVKSARTGERAAALGRRSAELSAASGARVSYYQWVRARLQVVVGERTVAQVGKTLEQVKALADVQRASKADLLRIQAQQAQAELRLFQFREQLALYEDQLRIQIGAGPDEPLTIGEDVRAELSIPELGTATALSDSAMQRRLDVKAIDTAVEAIGYQKKAVLADRLPKLSAFGSVNYDNPNQRVFP
jgi:outer membrane protein TolC